MIISQSSHCALIILMELSAHYELEGVLLSEISQAHHLPVEMLRPIAQHLCDLGIVHCEHSGEGDARWLFIKKNPSEIFVYDIVSIFDSEVFSGRFIESDTGKLLPTSKMTRMINNERHLILNYLQKRLKKINIKYWSESIQHTHYL